MPATIAVPTRLFGPVSIQLSDGELIAFIASGTYGAETKQIRFTMGSGSAQVVSWGILKVGQTPGTGDRWVMQDMPLQDADPVTDELTQVLAPGDRIIVSASGTGATVVMSGVVFA